MATGRSWEAAAVLFFVCLTTVSPFGLSPLQFSGIGNARPTCRAGVGAATHAARQRLSPPLRTGANSLFCSIQEVKTETESDDALVAKPVARQELVLKAKRPAHRPALRREFVDTIFQTMDIDGDGTVSKEEFLDGLHGIDAAVSEGAADVLFEDADAALSLDAFYDWACDGSEVADKLMHQVVRDQAVVLFEEIDTDGSGDIDAEELRVLAKAMGIKWSAKQAEDVIATIDQDGSKTVDFEEFFAWYYEQSTSAQKSLASAAGAQLRLMLRKTDAVDARRVLVKGAPLKATVEDVQHFFEGCGEINGIRSLPWARDGKPSGRSVITFGSEAGVAKALKMHRKRMGSRFLEVYRVNQGDKEERFALAKELHSAVIGVNGVHLQRMEEASGARVFLQSNETDGWVIVKGTADEREAAMAMIEAETHGVDGAAVGTGCDTVEIDAARKGLVIGKGGRTIVRLEVESGAKVEVRDGQEEGRAMVVLSGLPMAREKASELLEELLQTTGESAHAMPSKFHGTLKGKRGALVQALQAEMDSFVQFDSADGGTVRIRGPQRIRDQTWAMIQQLRKEVPPVLTLLRGSEIEAGELQSRPGFAGKVDDSDMWPYAAKEAIHRAKAALKVQAADSKEA